MTATLSSKFLNHSGRRWIAGALLLIALTGQALAQTVALTFDDGFDIESAGPQAVSDNAAIIDALKQHSVRSMLFPSGVAIGHPANLALVRAWGENGHAIGNHTYSHWALGKSDTPKYLADVARAHELLQALPGWCPNLRFPYLDEGATPAQHEQVMAWLAQHGYGVAAATISMPDWHWEKQYLDMLQSGLAAQASALRQDYIQQILAQAQAQDARWTRQLKRRPAHVLLLHTTHLNASVLPELLQALKSAGWTLIDPVRALDDPIYQRSYSGADGAPVVLPPQACH